MPFLIAICASILNASFKSYPPIRRLESLTLPVVAVLPKYVLKIPPKTSAPPWKAAPKMVSPFSHEREDKNEHLHASIKRKMSKKKKQ